jgi:hypothetical protein
MHKRKSESERRKSSVREVLPAAVRIDCGGSETTPTLLFVVLRRQASHHAHVFQRRDVSLHFV